ncbi:Ig-like domain-containing protein [Peterkaempfera bronchialis]|uniref:Ig-like domain-containing protein n=1 Tax=Peterkaempfera bronchialis TaxID=2126346 RepID=UPI003C2EC91C
MAVAAALALSAPATAWADDPSPAPGGSTTGITAVTTYESFDTKLQARPAPLPSGAYWGQVDIRADIAPDAGFVVKDLSNATLTITDASGGTTTITGTAYAYNGYYAWFHLDTKNLPDGPVNLHVSVDETATDGTAPEQSRTLETDATVRTANPHLTAVSPARQAVVWGPTTFSVDAQPSADGTPIDHVDFYYIVGNTPAATDSTAPYTFTTTFAGLAGYRTVTAVAVDRDGYRSAPMSFSVTASPGPSVTVDPYNRTLDENGGTQFGISWTAALPNGWNTVLPGPQYLQQWLTEVSIAVDGRTVVTHRESDGCWTPLGLDGCRYHNVKANWSEELPQAGLGLGTHQIAVTATDSTGASHTTATTVTVVPNRLQLFVQQLPRAGVVQGRKVSAAVQLRSGLSEAVPSRPVALQARYAGSSVWHTVAKTSTLANGTGRWFDFVPKENATYRAVTTDSKRQLVSTSTFTVKVAPKLALKASAARVAHGKTVRFTATASSRETRALVDLQVYRSGRWYTVATARQSAAGAAAFTLREKAKGHFSYRVVTRATARFTTATSSVVRITVT